MQRSTRLSFIKTEARETHRIRKYKLSLKVMTSESEGQKILKIVGVLSLMFRMMMNLKMFMKMLSTMKAQMMKKKQILQYNLSQLNRIGLGDLPESPNLLKNTIHQSIIFF